MTLAFLALLGAPYIYIYVISSLRVNHAGDFALHLSRKKLVCKTSRRITTKLVVVKQNHRDETVRRARLLVWTMKHLVFF